MPTNLSPGHVRSPAPVRRAARRPLALGLLGGVALLLGTLVGAPAASAHDELISTTPADGAVLSAAPKDVRLTFSERALAIGTAIRVTGPAGDVVSVGTVRLESTSVVQSLGAALPAGPYTVLWRVTSADGHPVSGTFHFSLAAAAGSGAAADATATGAAPGTPTTSATAAASVPASGGAGTSAAALPGAGAGTSGGPPAALLAAGVVVPVAAVASVWVLLRRRGGGTAGGGTSGAAAPGGPAG